MRVYFYFVNASEIIHIKCIPHLPQKVCVNATIRQSTVSNAFPFVTSITAPVKSSGTPINNIASSLTIRFINTKFSSVLWAWNKFNKNYYIDCPKYRL